MEEKTWAKHARIVGAFRGEEGLWLQLSCGLGRHAARDRAILEPKITNLMEAAAGF